ncbi:hypothetical protein SAMN03159363_5838 [Variovorax sp. EL159]|nr:hypothetical protein SAMN03159363_5838 [Variovorax sp. EL159]
MKMRWSFIFCPMQVALKAHLLILWLLVTCFLIPVRRGFMRMVNLRKIYTWNF